MIYLDHMVWPRPGFKMDFHRNRVDHRILERTRNKLFNFGVSMGVLFYCIVSSRCPVLIHPYYMGWENHWNYHQHPPTKKTIDYIKGNQIRQRNIQDLLYNVFPIFLCKKWGLLGLLSFQEPKPVAYFLQAPENFGRMISLRLAVTIRPFSYFSWLRMASQHSILSCESYPSSGFEASGSAGVPEEKAHLTTGGPKLPTLQHWHVPNTS